MIRTILSPLRRFAHREDGATMIEFAVVLPLFMLLLFGVIDFARLGYTNVMATTATDIAVRTAVVQPAACAGVPKLNARGVIGLASLDLPNGTACTARDGLCRVAATVSCTGSLDNPTVAGIWARVAPLLPPDARPENLLFSYSFDENLNRVGAAYAPIVTVALTDLTFSYISPLGALADLAGGPSDNDPTIGQSFTFQSMSASLPAEDLR